MNKYFWLFPFTHLMNQRVNLIFLSSKSFFFETLFLTFKVFNLSRYFSFYIYCLLLLLPFYQTKQKLKKTMCLLMLLTAASSIKQKKYLTSHRENGKSKRNNWKLCTFGCWFLLNVLTCVWTQIKTWNDFLVRVYANFISDTRVDNQPETLNGLAYMHQLDGLDIEKTVGCCFLLNFFKNWKLPKQFSKI